MNSVYAVYCFGCEPNNRVGTAQALTVQTHSGCSTYLVCPSTGLEVCPRERDYKRGGYHPPPLCFFAIIFFRFFSTTVFIRMKHVFLTYKSLS
jgi:hypothetical protein